MEQLNFRTCLTNGRAESDLARVPKPELTNGLRISLSLSLSLSEAARGGGGPPADPRKSRFPGPKPDVSQHYTLAAFTLKF